MRFSIPPEPATLPPAGTLARRLVLAMDENTRLNRPSMWRWFDPRELVCPDDANRQWFIINTDGLLFPVTAQQLTGDLVASALFGRLDVACLDNWEQAVGYYRAYYNARVRRHELEAEALNPASPPEYVTSEGSPSTLASDYAHPVVPDEASAPPAVAAGPSLANADPILPQPASSPAPPSPSSPASATPIIPPDVSHYDRAFYDENYLFETAPRSWELTAGDFAPDDYMPPPFPEDFVVREGNNGPVAGPSTARHAGPSTRRANAPIPGPSTRQADSGSNMDLDVDEEDGNTDDSGSEYMDDGDDGSDTDTTLSPYEDEDGDPVIPVKKGKKKARSKGKGKFKVVKRLKLNSTAATRITCWYPRRRIVVDDSPEESPAVSAPRSPTSSEITHISATPEPEDSRPFVPLFPEPDVVQPTDEQSPASPLSPGPDVPTFRYLNSDVDSPYEVIVDLPPNPPPVQNAVAGPSSATQASPARSDDSSGLLWDADFTPEQLVLLDQRLAKAREDWIKSLSLD
ncbi:hypothetical protein CVT26_009397 [Gymnopilus dilepis]|uniref:Uncharacterized protein n=1 Tax=Gymnopilus dilepis TaxID=231916 RepID=A0A409YIG5_9AGAR|nr:hypothetical protein CVT26_009397 [Gymnopilus dilepis]